MFAKNNQTAGPKRVHSVNISPVVYAQNALGRFSKLLRGKANHTGDLRLQLVEVLKLSTSAQYWRVESNPLELKPLEERN